MVMQSEPDAMPSRLDETRAYLRAMFEPDDFVSLRPIEIFVESGKKQPRVVNELVVTLPASHLQDIGKPLLADWLAAVEKERANPFIGVCPRESGPGLFDKAWQIPLVRCLWCDIDNTTTEEVQGRLNAAGLPEPSLIVESGNGVHLYWLLTEPLETGALKTGVLQEWHDLKGKRRPVEFIRLNGEQVWLSDPKTGKPIAANQPVLTETALHIQDVLKGIAAAIGGDHTFDLSRLLRLPGTLNLKNARNGEKPKECRLVSCKPELRYPFGDFEHFAAQAPDRKRREMVAAIPLPVERPLTPTRTDKLTEKIQACQTAEDRSRADFALCCYAIEEGISQSEVWGRCKDKGKFAERGESYFQMTWNCAAQHMREQMFVAHSSTASEGKKIERLSNYEMVPAEDGEGENSKSHEPLSLQLITEELHKKVGDWPRSVNGILFALNDNEQPRFLKDRNDLFAWIGEQFDAPADFKSGLHSRDEFFAHLRENSMRYDTIEHAPHFPEWKTSYYCHDPLPDGADGSFLSQFLDFFNPEAEADKVLLLAFVLTLAWGGPPGKRPAFLFQADGPGSGKSVLAHLVASLFGGYISIPKNIDNFERIVSRLLTPSAFSKRMLLMDNVKKLKLSTADLESLITEPIISGHRYYHGEGTRPNNLTVVITANSPQLGIDLSERVIVVNIRRSNYSATWDEDVAQFVEENRVEIWSDVIAMLASSTEQIVPVSRFGPWENEVLSKVPGFESAQRVLLSRQKEINADFEALNAFEDYITCRLDELKYRTASSDASEGVEEDTQCVFISNEQMAKWYSDFTGTRASSENIKQKLTVLRQKRVNCLIHDKRLNSCRGFIFGPWVEGDNYATDLEERIRQDALRQREVYR